ncbi:FliG C-terminal domain-containing protein [Candidatus Riflebacteria bacterium]
MNFSKNLRFFPGRRIPEILRKISLKDLAIALHGEPEEFSKVFYRFMPESIVFDLKKELKYAKTLPVFKQKMGKEKFRSLFFSHDEKKIH